MSVRLGLLVVGLSFLAACTPPAPSERIEVSPESLSLQFAESQPVTARVYVGGKLASLEGITWSSSDPATVAVTAGEGGTATVQGLQGGTATVTATVRSASASLSVTVAPRPVVLERIELTPADAMLAKGLRLQLTATGVYNDGSTKDLTSTAAWASGNGTRATVSAGGLVSGLGLGEVEIRALKDGVTGRATLTITAATVIGIDVRPATASLARGTSQQFSATARLSDASTQVVTSQVSWAFDPAAIASVDSAGKLSALDLGTGTLSATLGAISGTAEVTVTSAVLQTLEMTPAAFSLPLGSTQQLTVNGRFSDGSMQDLTAQATWRSGTPLVATVSSGGLVTAAGLGLSIVTGTVNGISANASVTCTAAQLSLIQVAPQGLSLALGLERSFTAVGVYTDSTTRDLTATLIWSSSDAGVATVSNLAGEIGLVRSQAEGTTTIAATNGALTGTSTLTIAPAILVGLQVMPATASVPRGLTTQASARGTFSDGSQRDVTASVVWTSSAPTVAQVSSAAGSEGLITALNQGTATITASSGLSTASLAVTVGAPVLQGITVSAPAPSLAKGRTQQLTATGSFSDGSTQELTGAVTWAPATGAVLRVSTAGVMTAVGEGTASATATLGAVVGGLSLTVTPAELDTVTVSPATASIALGLTRTLSATGQWSDGTVQPLTTGVTWSSTDDTVATVSTSGLVTSQAQGACSITASFMGVSGSSAVTVTPPELVSLTVTPASPSVDKAQSVQFTASGLYSDSSTADLSTQVTWQSSATAIATIDGTGLAQGVTPGQSTISATLSGVTGSTTLTVNRPAVSTITVSPASGSVVRGGTLAFTAQATYVDSSTEDVTALATWSSSDEGLATIASTGVARGVALGTVTITATFGSVPGTAQLTITAPVLQSISVTGRSPIGVASSTRLVATGTYSDSSTAEVTAQATWVSTAPAVARVNMLDGVRGVTEGLSAGSASITATVGSVSSAAFAIDVLATNAAYAGRCGPGVIISQVFGGGGNAGAPWQNDFVELHNPTGSSVNIGGWSLQYTSSAGTTWSNQLFAFPTGATIAPGGYYLVQLATGGANGAALTQVDQTGTFNMSATAGKLALVNTSTALTVSCPTGGAVVDFVGFGSAANCFEGTAPTPAPSNSTSIVRGASGCRDGNQNGTDFTVSSAVVPRSGASAKLLCSCFANGVGAPVELQSCQLDSPASLMVNAGEVSAPVAATITQPGITDAPGFSPSLRVQVGFGPSGVDPRSQTGWRWWPTVGRTAGSTSDGYDGLFVAPASGSYGFTARATVDGVNWTACDLNGAGSGSGLSFEMGQLGILTVP